MSDGLTSDVAYTPIIADTCQTFISKSNLSPNHSIIWRQYYDNSATSFAYGWQVGIQAHV